ncbi:MAG: RAMP superfamily CRISPR-associated protein [Oscillochloridaceae bacterium]|nr:RAMP superfamily CRISPR-associated protein [Chloroflexaceae bacterium]MDW8388676.1 RAMP superfamily CRISPR-associated protein [Oscillochloridaceae bacterium]
MELRIALTITSRTPVSVGAGGSVGALADKSIVRDGWGRPIIPGSQVKGKLRWAAEQLLRGLGQDVPTPFEGPKREELPTLVRDLFGSPRQRSPLFFADLPGVIGDPARLDALRDSPEQRRSQIRPSVALDRRRRTAADNLLVFQETALETTSFYSERAITGRVDSLDHVALLWVAAGLSTRWGGAKSRGLGWAEVTARVWVDGDERSADQLRADVRALVAGSGGR